MDRAIKTYVFILFFGSDSFVKRNVGFIVNLKGNSCPGVSLAVKKFRIGIVNLKSMDLAIMTCVSFWILIRI